MTPAQADASARSTDSALRVLLRTVAVLIAIAAVVDPSVTTERQSKPVVSVVPSDAVQDVELATRVADALDDEFTVIRSAFGNADALVLVGDRVRRDLEFDKPIFAVQPGGNQPRIQSLHAPASASVHAPVRVDARVFLAGANARAVVAELQVNGVAMERRSLALDGTQQHALASMTFVPTDTGSAAIRVVARAGADSAYADGVVAIHARPLSILVYDPRPSYSSTFVRRALEKDPRLLVTSRVVTSRDISTSTGAPPAQLSNAETLAPYEAIVVGAPDALSARDVEGLDTYLRARGGSVMLLLDNEARGPFEQLTGVRNWSSRNVDRGAVARRAVNDNDQLRVSAQFWPASLPVGATVLWRAAATRSDSFVRGTDASPIIWRTAVGNGRLVVSGALDAWRYRDPEVSDFDRVFTHIITDAAEAAMPAVSVSVGQRVLAPHETTPVAVTIRDAGFGEQRGDAVNASVTAVVSRIDSIATAAVPLRLFPGATPGTFRGAVRAPAEPGHAQLSIAANGDTAVVPLVVSEMRHHPIADEPALLTAWVASRGGWTVDESALPTLAGRLQSSLAAAPRPERWHPMRSAWWLLPFALCLSAEWWLRRRRGLP